MTRNLTSGFALALVLVTVGHATEKMVPAQFAGMRKIWASLAPVPRMRDRVLNTLGMVPGKHLVFVRYGPQHAYIDEWVFNKADIPGAQVVFSRLIDPESDLELIRQMKDYDVWLVDPDAGLLTMVNGDQVSQESMLWPEPLPTGGVSAAASSR